MAGCYHDKPQVPAGVLDRQDPEGVFQPLDLYARAAPEHPTLAATRRSVLSEQLGQLCATAITQAATTRGLELCLGETTVAAALDRAVTLIGVDPQVLPGIVDRSPPRPDLILGSLVLTLTGQLADHMRRLAAANPAAYEPDLAMLLNNLSVRLGDAGRWEEGLAAITVAVEVYRRLAAANPAAYEPAARVDRFPSGSHLRTSTLGSADRPT